MRRSRRSVVVQVALSLALFVGATLFAQSYFFLARFDRGYDAEGMLLAHVALDRSRYADAASDELAIEAFRARLATDSRIERMALAGQLEKLRLSGTDAKAAKAGTPTGWGLYLPGQTEHSADRDLRPSGSRLVVSDGYFAVLGIRIVHGRGFGDVDVPGGTSATVVSERVAKTFWPGADPIGRTFTYGPAGPSFTVVGVARDVRDPTASLVRGSSTAAWPHVYFSARQATYRPELYIRPRAPVAAVQSAVESALRSVEPEAALWQVKTLASRGEAQMLTEIFGGAVGGFALCGAFLAMLGVIAYGVAQRRREIGLRIALGASPSQVVRLFTRQGARFIAVGLGVGMVLALGLSAHVRGLVWGVSPFDPVSYVVAAVVFGGVALVACWLPARRAARVEPMEALRTL